MWEPPPPATGSPENSRHHQDEFQLCKSAFRLGEFPASRFAATLHYDTLIVGAFSLEAPPSVSPTDSDSEEDEPQFYLASESSGKIRQVASRPKHNLSLLSLTVMINKGRLQARTDKKVSRPSGRPPARCCARTQDLLRQKTDVNQYCETGNCPIPSAINHFYCFIFLLFLHIFLFAACESGCFLISLHLFGTVTMKNSDAESKDASAPATSSYLASNPSPSHFLCLQDDQTHGEIVLDLEGGKIFSVAQHQNNPNLNFLCVESKQVELYHKGTGFSFNGKL